MTINECESIYDMQAYMDSYMEKKRLGIVSKKPTMYDVKLLDHCDRWIDWAADEIFFQRLEISRLKGKIKGDNQIE